MYQSSLAFGHAHQSRLLKEAGFPNVLKELRPSDRSPQDRIRLKVSLYLIDVGTSLRDHVESHSFQPRLHAVK